MKSFVGLFLIAGTFGLVIEIVYWFTAKGEAAGTVLLGIMTIALVFTASYAIVAERNANLEGDNPGESKQAVAGEEIGIFTTESPYPILIAVSALATLVGIIWVPVIGIAGLIALILCFWRLGAESART